MVVGIVRLYRSPLEENLFIAKITQKLKRNHYGMFLYQRKVYVKQITS